MRADRLVTLLLLLQRHERLTAREAARELEVSERTARRDLESLGIAGLPVYALRGRHGGWTLAGGGRTDLSGLTAPEVRALFSVAGLAPTLTPELRTALRKLVRALPEPFRRPAEAASAAVVVDGADWGQTAVPAARPPHLDRIQEAIVEGRQVVLGYRSRADALSLRVVHPLGVVVKSGAWYLVAGTTGGQRSFRVDRVISVELQEEAVERPPGFDLSQAWSRITREVELKRSPLSATALAQRQILPALEWVFGSRLALVSTPADGLLSIEVRGGDERSLAGELAGFAGLVEVVEPESLRACLAGLGQELVSRYGEDRANRGP
ncbi:MAG: helix-turn-helix transcriptional regulator [Candidatus Dormibacteria bacterium]